MTATQDPTDGFVYDPFSRAAMNDPLPLYEVLRDNYPVYNSQKYDAFFVSRFEDNWSVLSDPDNTFPAPEGRGAVARAVMLAHNDGPVPEPPLDFFTGIQHDSPYYELARQAHGSQLRPGAVKKLEPFIRDIAAKRLDELLPRGRFDITQEYAGIVSASTICHPLRIPLESGADMPGDVHVKERLRPPAAHSRVSDPGSRAPAARCTPSTAAPWRQSATPRTCRPISVASTSVE